MRVTCDLDEGRVAWKKRAEGCAIALLGRLRPLNRLREGTVSLHF